MDTDSEGNRYCRSRDCDQIAAVDAYCRYHYHLFWRKIQNRKKILADGKLERYIEELTARYPDKFTSDDAINRDLATERQILEGKTPNKFEVRTAEQVLNNIHDY